MNEYVVKKWFNGTGTEEVIDAETAMFAALEYGKNHNMENRMITVKCLATKNITLWCTDIEDGVWIVIPA